MLKIVEVGLYWAKIKGRFRSNNASSGAERRIYLAIKYGNIWRTRVIMRQIEMTIGKEINKILTNKKIDHS